MSPRSDDTGRLATIYGLFDGEVCMYVGVTLREDLKARMREHRCRANKGDTKPVYAWMRAVADISIRVLQADVPPSRRYDVEAEWIEKLGPPCNMIVKWEWTLDMIERRVATRRAGRGWTLSEEARKRISEANTGRTGHWLGKTMTDSHVWGFSGERNGHALLTDAAVLDMRTRCAQGESVAALAKEYGVSNRTASRAIRGETYGSAGVTKPPDAKA